MDLPKAKVTGRWHDNRHTLITDLAESGAGDETIREIAGHVSKQMLKHYSHIRMEAKRTALESIVAKKADPKPAEAEPQGHLNLRLWTPLPCRLRRHLRSIDTPVQSRGTKIITRAARRRKAVPGACENFHLGRDQADDFGFRPDGIHKLNKFPERYPRFRSYEHEFLRPVLQRFPQSGRQFADIKTWIGVQCDSVISNG